MAERTAAGAVLQGVRVFLVHINEHESIAIVLRALGADVRVFASLHDADLATVPVGMTILVVRLPADHQGDTESGITLVERGFGIAGILRAERLAPSFSDRFVELHRGRVEPSSLCESIIRAASRGGRVPPGISGNGIAVVRGAA